jgi:hypothetical protein
MLARATLLRFAITMALVLGLLAQGRMPASPWDAPGTDPFWALGGICGPGHASDVPGGPAQDQHHHNGACCQLWPTAFVLPGRAVAGAPGPILVLRREIVSEVAHFGRGRLAYASRAPPARG